jgi:hypothetical protein
MGALRDQDLERVTGSAASPWFSIGGSLNGVNFAGITLREIGYSFAIGWAA